MINQARKERLLEKVRELAYDLLTEKDREVLEKLLTTEPMLKALGQVYRGTMAAHAEFGNVDFSDHVQCHNASRMQGHIQGAVQGIELLFQLITLPEEIEDDSPDTAD